MPTGYDQDRFQNSMFWKAQEQKWYDPVTEQPIPGLVTGAGKQPRHGLMRWQALPVNNISGTMSLTANQWFGATFRSPVPIMAARIALRFGSGALANAVGYAAAQIQPLATGSPTVWPYQIDAGDGSGAVNVHNTGAGNFTWDGVAAGTPVDDSGYPSANGGSAAGVLNPAGSGISSGATCALIWSDWKDLKIAPVRAADGWYYYGVAVQNGASNIVPAYVGTAGKLKALLSDSTYAAAQCLQFVDSYTMGALSAFVDQTVNTATSLARQSSGYFESCPVAALEVLTPARVTQVAALCDSQLTGYSTSVSGATVEAFGGIKRACMAASSASNLIQYVDTGMPGADFTTWMQTWLAGTEQIAPNAAGRGQSSLVTGVWRPDILFIQPFSANDNSASPTTATMRLNFGKALRLAELCRRSRITPVLCTVPPGSGRYTTTTTAGDMSREACRRQLNLMLRNAAAADSNFKLLDTDLIVADNTSSPSTIATAYNGGDGLHFSDAGNAAIATAAQTIIAALA